MRTGWQLRDEARQAAEVLGPLPPRLQMWRLGESARLLDQVTLAAALGLAQPSTLLAVESPRLVAARIGSLFRVQDEVAELVPPRAKATHWTLRAMAELRRQVVELHPMAPRVRSSSPGVARGPRPSPGWEAPAPAPALPPR